jgi:hypothetical protein
LISAKINFTVQALQTLDGDAPLGSRQTGLALAAPPAPTLQAS